MTRVVVNNLKELEALAGKLANAFKKGQLKKVGLIGPLGAGKTTFVGLVARALGYDQNTSSPTFTIMHEYLIPSGLMLHIDLYRLNPKDQETVSMVRDRMENASFTLIEWVDKLPALEKMMDRIYVLGMGDTAASRVVTINTRPT